MSESPETSPSPALDPEQLPETVATYLRLRGLPASARSRRRRRVVDDDNQPFTPGRDPRSVGDAVAGMTKEAGWDTRLSQEELVLRWAELAGEDTARHASPVALSEGTLTIQCDSTAWAKQLQFMRSQLLTRILERHPDAGITTLRFIGPDVPSWKWGPRAIPGRGPRDTYG